MAEKSSLGNALRQLDETDLITVFNALMDKSQDEDDRLNVMKQFEEEFPGLHEFVLEIDDAEKKGVFSDEQLLEVGAAEAEEFGPTAYGMLLGFLTLRELSRKAELDALFDQ